MIIINGGIIMENCLFCKITSKQIPSDICFEDDFIIAFKDIHPKAPVHILIVPKKHIASVADLTEEDKDIISRMIFGAKQIAHNVNLENNGYRLVFNTRAHAGQEIEHIHLHLLGGKQLGSMC